jgi:hypothetical protein
MHEGSSLGAGREISALIIAGKICASRVTQGGIELFVKSAIIISQREEGKSARKPFFVRVRLPRYGGRNFAVKISESVILGKHLPNFATVPQRDSEPYHNIMAA